MAAGAAPARSFAPIEGPVARVLVLGTMPGTASLGAHEYYAHPMNAFWPIVLSILDGTPPDRRAWREVPHGARAARLAGAGLAVWDVLAECRRPGSLDGAIVRSSEIANDVAALVGRHPELRLIAFNGRGAERLFERHVRLADAGVDGPALASLPSTSPAMATLGLEAKRAAWAAALGPVVRTTSAGAGRGTGEGAAGGVAEGAADDAPGDARPPRPA